MDQTSSRIPATSRTPTSSVRWVGMASNIPAKPGSTHWRNLPRAVAAGAFAEAVPTETGSLASGVEDTFADPGFGREEPASDGAKTGVASVMGIEVVGAWPGVAWVVLFVGGFPVVLPAL